MSTDDAGWWQRPDENPYECRTCGSPFDRQHFVCPECGGFSVDRRYPQSDGV